MIVAPVVAFLVLTGVIHPPTGHWPAFLVLLVETAILAAGIGVLLGVVCKRSSTVALAAVIVASYLFFLGGGFTTIAFLPEWLRVVSHAIPTRYAIDGMRQALFYPDLRGMTTDLLALGLFSLAVPARVGRGCHRPEVSKMRRRIAPFAATVAVVALVVMIVRFAQSSASGAPADRSVAVTDANGAAPIPPSTLRSCEVAPARQDVIAALELNGACSAVTRVKSRLHHQRRIIERFPPREAHQRTRSLPHVGHS